ncbi:hypothetical protein BDV97DRAFT_352398 [Delphinella strobiligena]|nr:hypothetical protein BDV97DRAFT_352398 [Delphinella strobiligena]
MLMIGIDRQFVLSRNLPFTSPLSCSRKDYHEYLFLHLHSRDDGVQETDNVVLRNTELVAAVTFELIDQTSQAAQLSIASG